MAAMLRLEQAEKRYGAHVALKALDLEVASGETVVVIGPSGCGKSTLLGLMNGLIAPDGGRVLFDGEVLSPPTVQAARRRMGYVIQEGGLFPHLSAGRNVTLMAELTGWDKARIADRLDGLCTLTSFPAEALARYPAELSGGQCQRVALMRALMLDPDILLLDEPLGALDPLIRFDLQEELAAIFGALGKTVVLVTHDLDEAAFFAGTIVLMRDGAVVQTGGIDALAERPADPFVTRFITAQRGHWRGAP
jgi:osmoprotectant transport system ATP-binding protein